MDDLISRQAAIEALEEPCKVPDTWTDEFAVGERSQWEKDVKALNSLPSAERRGRWLRTYHNKQYKECSTCGKVFSVNLPKNANYCPNCGSRMDLEGDAE